MKVLPITSRVKFLPTVHEMDEKVRGVGFEPTNP